MSVCGISPSCKRTRSPEAIPTRPATRLTTCDRTENKQRLLPRNNGFRKGSVRRLMRKIFLASKKAKKRAALLRDVVANGSRKHGIRSLKSIEHGANCDLTSDFDGHFTADMRQCPQMRRKDDANLRCGATSHERVCASTDKTAGRSRTMGDRKSPASLEQ